MKRIVFYISLISVWVILFSACIAEDAVDNLPDLKEDLVSLHLTTPTHSQCEVSNEGYFPETRGTHVADEAKIIEDRIERVHLLLFDEAGGILKDILPMNKKNEAELNYQVAVQNIKKAYVRIVANASVDASWVVGMSWSDLQAKTYQLDETGGVDMAYPLVADIGVRDLSANPVIGTSEAPVRLLRSFAKLSVVVAQGSGMEVSGFCTFGIRKQGYVFPHTPVSSATTEKYDEPSAAYDNHKTTVFLPESTNEDAHQTFIIIKAKYKGLEGFYRLDIRDTKAAFMPIEHNKHYIVRVNQGLGYGYPTEAEAVADPYNDTAEKVVIETEDAYDFTYNENGNFLNFTNSTAVIYGKASYYEDGFSGELIDYPYLLAGIKTDNTTPIEGEIEIIDAGGLSVQLLVNGSTAYLISSMENAVKGLNTIRIRYKNMVKSFHVYWMDQYLDCTYVHLPLTTDGKTPLQTTTATIRDTFYEYMGDTHDFEVGNWGGLSLAKENASMDGPLSQGVNLQGSSVYLQLREYVGEDYRSELEAFRFVDIFASGTNHPGRIKYIVGQATADLSGYFGGTSLVAYSAYDTDDGTKYDSYLVSERITDEVYSSGIPLSDYCKSKNPKGGEQLWYLPSGRQLRGLWLTDNSNSRKTSPMTEEYYISRNNYTQEQVNYYNRTKSLYQDSNNDWRSLYDDPTRYPMINWTTGETFRNPQTVNAAVRCVRNLPKQVLNPVSGKTVSIDPAGKLTDDYFDAKAWNPLARKIQIADPHGNVQDKIVFEWTNDGHGEYVFDRTESDWNIMWYEYTHYYKWVNKPGWKRNGAARNNKDRGDSYTIFNREENAPPVVNTVNLIPKLTHDKEYTLATAYSQANTGGNRLPTMRELQMIYIYHSLLVNAGMPPFYKEERDAYYVGPTIPDPNANQLTWLKYRYGQMGNNTNAYLHWYWSSTTQKGSFNGNDNGSVLPLRLNFNFGDVNTRAANMQSELDHYRGVKTVN